MNWHLILAIALAALLPIALMITGGELRRVRLRIIEDLIETVFKAESELPQVKLAKARYTSTQNSASPSTRQDEVRQKAGGLIYTLVCALGFTLLFDPISYLIGDAKGLLSVWTSLFWLPDHLPEGTAQNIALHRGAAIAGFAFLGGYTFNVGYLVRATLNQELSALAFVRAALRLVEGMIVAVVIYHVGATVIANSQDVVAGVGSPSPGFAMGLAVAFVVGYFPDVGKARIAQIARIYIKGIDKDALNRAKIIPLEVIDGIDHEVSFRLQESNLYDVQNLAVANPIQLTAETPYGLLQLLDWILQAQLCLVAGSEAFLELKRHRIRTIFDLERALLAEGVPDDYLRAIAGVLLKDSSECFRAAIGLAKTYGDCTDPDTALPLILRHIAAIVSDDVHVHRLRALWRAIVNTTDGMAADGKPLWLFETAWLPGEPPRPEATKP